MVVIRLARRGAKKHPFYHVQVADRRSPRDGRYIERVGYFNPCARGAEVPLFINMVRIAHWQAQGAQASDRVKHLLKKFAAGDIKSAPVVKRDDKPAAVLPVSSDTEAGEAEADKVIASKSAAEPAVSQETDKSSAADKVTASESAAELTASQVTDESSAADKVTASESAAEPTASQVTDESSAADKVTASESAAEPTASQVTDESSEADENETKE